jgi:DMSO reductase anchor subunit
MATPILGIALGTATTTTYTAASAVIPARARGAGFGLLTTASLTGLALSPILSGLLGATSIRAVFLLDVLVMVTIATAVPRLMVIPAAAKPTTPTHEEI